MGMLCGEIQELVRQETGHSAFIAIDQEGGSVTRFPADAVNVPGAMALGASGDPENAYRAGMLIGREMRALGPNFNFAPTVDVNSNPKNPEIGVRSYGDDPHMVGRYAAQSVRGLLEGGVLCAAKHFPGHGDTDVDSHLGLPCVDKSLEELDESVNRILEYKARWIEGEQSCDFDFAAAAEESRRMLEQTITELSRPAAGKLSLKEPLCIGCEPYRASLVGNVDERQGNPFGVQMTEELGGACADMERNPSPEAIAALVERAKEHGCAVVGTFNAYVNPGQLELIRALADGGVSTAVVALRSPYDLRDLPEGVWAIAAYEYSPGSIRAAAKVLRGDLQPTGKLPVRL